MTTMATSPSQSHHASFRYLVQRGAKHGECMCSIAGVQTVKRNQHVPLSNPRGFKLTETVKHLHASFILTVAVGTFRHVSPLVIADWVIG